MKKTKEVYDETAHGGYLTTKQANKRETLDSNCNSPEKRGIPITDLTRQQINEKKNNVFNTSKRSFNTKKNEQPQNPKQPNTNNPKLKTSSKQLEPRTLPPAK